jgi:hypothetical protein
MNYNIPNGLKKSAATLAASGLVIIMSFAMVSPAIALPTPSPELPSELQDNIGGMGTTFTLLNDDLLRSPSDADFASAYLQPHDFDMAFSVTNYKWASIKLLGADVRMTDTTDVVPTTFIELGDGTDTTPKTAEELGIKAVRVSDGTASSSPLLETVIPNGGTYDFNVAATVPRSNLEYRHSDGTLAAYAYNAEFAVFFEGTASNGTTYVVETVVALNHFTPVFADITTGQYATCDDSPELCVDSAGYGFRGAYTTRPYAPLMPVVVTPPAEVPPVTVEPPLVVTPPAEVPPVTVEPPVVVTPPAEVPPVTVEPPVVVTPPAVVETPQAETPPAVVAPKAMPEVLAHTGADGTIPLAMSAAVLLLLGVPLFLFSSRRKMSKP